MANEITFGQLRTQLKSVNARWTPGPAQPDNAVVPLHKLGGKTDNLIETARAPRLDLARLLATPSANPLLDARRRATGLPASTTLRTLPMFTAAHTAAPQGAAPQGGGGPAAAPAVVDWRNRGWPWLCTVQDQIGENCWAMSATALVETMTRINHGVWSKRSEGDVHDGMGAPCDQGGSTQAALDWIKAHGQTDLDNYMTQCNLPYHTAADRDGRTVKIGDYSVIGDSPSRRPGSTAWARSSPGSTSGTTSTPSTARPTPMFTIGPSSSRRA